MKADFKTSSFLRLLSLFILSLTMSIISANDDDTELLYVQIEPIIVTNYQNKSSRKPGFIQISAQLIVKGKKTMATLDAHMPLVRAYIIEFLNFTDESVIKDVSKRRELRASITLGIQKMLSKEIGTPLVEELVITQFMWD